jgi:hypothetical protein
VQEPHSPWPRILGTRQPDPMAEQVDRPGPSGNSVSNSLPFKLIEFAACRHSSHINRKHEYRPALRAAFMLWLCGYRLWRPLAAPQEVSDFYSPDDVLDRNF